MDSLTLVNKVQNSLEFQQASLENKLAVNQELAQVVKNSGELNTLDYKQENEITNYIKTNVPGLKNEATDPRSKALIEQANSMKTGKADMSLFDGLLESSRDYLTGKVITAGADLVSSDDLSDELYGSKDKELEKYRDYVASVYKPEGMTDYKIGKVVGNVLGFAADAFVMSKLYGVVGAPGIVGKLLGQGTSAKVLDEALTQGGKIKAYIPKLISQGAIESGGYVAQTGVADYITGQLNSRKDVQEFINQIPSEAGKGFAYFAFGEGLGVGLGKAFKGLGKVFTRKGFQAETLGDVLRKDQDTSIEAVKDVIKNGTLSPEMESVLRANDFSSKEINKLRKLDTAAKLVNDSKSLADDPQELRKVTLQALYGVDSEKSGGGLKLTSFRNKPLKNPVFVESDQELKDFFLNQRKSELNSNWETSYKLHSGEKGNLKLKIETYKGKTVDVEASEVNDLFSIQENTKPEDISKVTEKLLPNTSVKVIPVEDYFQVARPLSKGKIFIPSKVSTPEQAAKFANDYFNQIEHLSNKSLKIDRESLVANLRGGSNVEYGNKFLTDNLARDQYRFNPDGTVDLKLSPDTDFVHFKNSIEASANLHVSMFQPEDVGTILAKKKGASLKLNDDNSLDVKLGKKTYKFSSYKDMFLDKNFRPNLPFENKNKYIWLAGDLQAQESLAEGTIKQLREKASKYEKEITSTLKQKGPNQLSFNPDFTKFVVESTDTGFTREFDTLDKAKRWLGKKTKTYADLREAFYEKGWKLSPEAGGYKLQTPGKDPVFAKTLKEVEEKAGSIENIFKTPDFFNGEERFKVQRVADWSSKYQEVIAQEKAKLDKIKSKYKGFGASRVKQFFDKFAVPIRERVEETGDPIAISLTGKAFAANKLFKAKWAETEKYLQGMFHGKGRAFSLKELQDMGDVLAKEGDPSKWKEFAHQAGITLEPKHLKTMSAVRDIMDIAGKKFGVKPNEWINNYFTRLRDMPQKDFLQLISTPRKGVGDVWFKHLRTEDYVAAQFQNNIETIVSSYLKVGYRELYLGDTVDDIVKVTFKARNPHDKSIEMDPKALKLLEDLNERVIGRTMSSDKAQSAAEKILVNQALAKNILEGKGDARGLSQIEREAKAHKIMNTDWNMYIKDMVTASLMAFKMKMPIRNVSQIYTVLSGITGPRRILASQIKMGDSDFAAQYFKKLYEKGIIKPRNNLALDHGVLMDTIKKWNDIGLNNFYHSDDYTRLISAHTTETLFRDNYRLLKAGKLDLKGFLKEIKTDYLSPQDSKRIAELINQNDFEAAETFLQRRFTDITMFDYDKLNKPEGLHSGLGKAFGQYSTYPFSYLQFWKRGIKAEPVKFTTRMLLSTMAISQMYSQVLGMKNVTPMNPMNTMMFTGGPMLLGGITSLSSLGRMVYEPSVGQAKGMLKSLTRTYMPYFGELSYLSDAVQNFDEGNYHAGTVNLLGSKASTNSIIWNNK